jgi:hypothetical protein
MAIKVVVSGGPATDSGNEMITFAVHAHIREDGAADEKLPTYVASITQEAAEGSMVDFLIKRRGFKPEEIEWDYEPRHNLAKPFHRAQSEAVERLQVRHPQLPAWSKILVSRQQTGGYVATLIYPRDLPELDAGEFGAKSLWRANRTWAVNAVLQWARDHWPGIELVNNSGA